MIESSLKNEDGQSNQDAQTIQSVLPFAELCACTQGEDLITTGQSSECFYYVEQGTFEVSYTARRTSIVLALIGAGAIFGEIGFFDQLTRTRNIRAVENSRLRIFDRKTMAGIHDRDPVLYSRFLEYLLRSVCGRFRQILSERGPLNAYAAALATGKEQFQGLQALPADLVGSSGWVQTNQYLEEFKAQMFDVAHRLQQDQGPHIQDGLSEQGRHALDSLKTRVRGFGAIFDKSQGADLIWGYVFKEVFPYLMRSRFAERAYYKPKGYAGDYDMIEQIYRNQPEGDGKLGKLIDAWILDQVPARAVRARRELLKQLLDAFCREKLSSSEDVVRIMNLACGPARELFDLLRDCNYSHRIDALCIDIDDEALQYADQKINVFPHRAALRFMNENVIRWAIGRTRQDFGLMDLIYSSGLCDYLDDRMLSALILRSYEHLSPGGSLIIGNFGPDNPDRFFMDHLLYWRLVHRSRKELLELFSQSPFGSNVRIVTEQEGINLFAVARKI